MADNCPMCGYYDISGIPFCLTCGACSGCFPCESCYDYDDVDDDVDEECFGCDKKLFDDDHCYGCGLCGDCKLEIMCENCAENKLTE